MVYGQRSLVCVCDTDCCRAAAAAGIDVNVSCARAVTGVSQAASLPSVALRCVALRVVVAYNTDTHSG